MIAKWVVNAIALYIVARVVPGIHLLDFGSALWAVIIIGLVNVLVKPLLVLLTLPITVVTLGLFLLVINAALLLLASSFAPGFTVDGFGSALLGSVVLSIVSWILHSLVN